MAGADDALSPTSNLLIGDGASVILGFGGDGSSDSNFVLGGFAALAGDCRPASRWPGISSVPEPGALALFGGCGPGRPNAVARKEVLNQRIKRLRIST